jgi:hypothetical protein
METTGPTITALTSAWISISARVDTFLFFTFFQGTGPRRTAGLVAGTGTCAIGNGQVTSALDLLLTYARTSKV